MDFKYKDNEITLDFATGNYMALRKSLGVKDLRKALLEAYNDEDYSVLAKGLFQFSGKQLPNADAAYSCMDAYHEETGKSRAEMFLEFIEGLGEAGFFKEKRDVESLRELAASPELELDMAGILREAVQSFQGEAVRQLVSGTIPTGANTSKLSVLPLMNAASTPESSTD